MTVVGRVGDTVTLPCQYDVSTYGISNVCWGRDQSWFNCERIVIATNGLTVNYRESYRHSLPSKLQHGDVSLTIKAAQKADTGFYVCRIEIQGLFNDISYSIYLIITGVCPSRCKTVTVFSGQNVTLPCKYDFTYYGKCEICWMRGDIPYTGCGEEIIASNGDKVVRQASQRYQLDGELRRGDASLTILGTTQKDSGKYGCRVHVPGWFNDEKVIVNLVIMKEPSSTEVNSLLPSTPELVTMDARHTGPTHVSSTRNDSNNWTPENEKTVKEQTDDIIPITLISILLVILGLGTVVLLIFARLSETPFKVTEGSTVILNCHYSVKQHGVSHVCWGRDCGTFWCNDIIVQTDESGVISKVSDRYRLIGDVLSGQMDLGIQRIRQTDGGPYCCRINIDGLFNDKKMTYTLKVVKAATTAASTTTTAFQSTEPPETDMTSSASPQASETDSSVFDISGQNFTLQNSNPVPDEAISSITLQINIPVLSLSLSLLLLLLGALALLAFKRGFPTKVIDSG
ncbi:T-cell immunoglobulin and mucin domain-containing protein 4-like, partial [Clarias magur]